MYNQEKIFTSCISQQQILESGIIQEVLSFLSWTLEKNKSKNRKGIGSETSRPSKRKKHVVSRVPKAWHWSRPLAEHVKQTMPFQLQSTVTAGLKEERKSHRGRSRYLGLYNEIKKAGKVSQQVSRKILYIGRSRHLNLHNEKKARTRSKEVSFFI